MARNLALKKDTAPEPLKVASAAERVSGELDKVIHERMRLGIISALAANEKLSFSDLKSLLNTTDGNISVYALGEIRLAIDEEDRRAALGEQPGAL